jgi:hypothetical protein
MFHMRYWTMSLSAAVAGGFLAIDRFAFAPTHAIWIAFGVAIAAAVFSLAATGLALVRQNHQFSGISALSALVAGFTIIATRAFTAPSALWLAFAGGVALLLLSLRALALHETTVERVVYALELDGSGEAIAVRPGQPLATSPVERLRDGLRISDAMRSWMHWLTHTTFGIAGAFVALTTFAWTGPVSSVHPRWLWFGIAAAAASIALTALAELGLAARGRRWDAATIADAMLTAAGAVAALGLVVLTAVHGVHDLRWWTFGLSSGMVGLSLMGSTIHELTAERVRHELEVAHAATTPEPALETAR